MKTRDRIRKTQIEWKGEELSVNTIGKVSNKLFKIVINELNNTLPILGKSVSEVSPFIT